MDPNSTADPNRLQFTFSDVNADKVELNVLDQYLGKAEIDSSGKQIQQMLLNERVGVLTMTLKSKKFVTSAQDGKGNDLSLQVPVIGGVASGSLKVGFESNRNTQLSYEGNVAVTFAAQGVQLFFDDAGHYTAFDPFNVGQHAIRGAEAQGADTRYFEPKMLRVQGTFALWQTDSKANAVGAQK